MASLLTSNDKRTKYCGEFTTADVGAEVCVMGWCQRQRDLGGLIFIDLRDRTGIVQLAFDNTEYTEAYDAAFTVRSEFVLCAKGTVRQRSAVNKNIPTGEIEIYVKELKILSTAALILGARKIASCWTFTVRWARCANPVLPSSAVRSPISTPRTAAWFSAARWTAKPPSPPSTPVTSRWS